MTSKNGKPFDGYVQFNVAKGSLDFSYDRLDRNKYRQENQQSQNQEPHQKVRIPTKLLGVDRDEKQQTSLSEGRAVYAQGMMKDGQDQPFNAYLKVNEEKGKLDFFKWNPDKAKSQGAEVKPAEANKTQVAVNTEGKTSESHIKKHPVCKPLPEHLQRRQEIIELTDLPDGSKRIGEEITEILEYIPGEIYVRQIIRKKYALPDGAGIVMGDLPGLPLPRSNAGTSLLANVLVSKFQDHQPLYRQIEILKRNGVHLAASTVND